MMTVQELIEALKSYDPDAVVYMEGCDCSGEADGVMSTDPGEVTIYRPIPR